MDSEHNVLFLVLHTVAQRVIFRLANHIRQLMTRREILRHACLHHDASVAAAAVVVANGTTRNFSHCTTQHVPSKERNVYIRSSVTSAALMIKYDAGELLQTTHATALAYAVA